MTRYKPTRKIRKSVARLQAYLESDGKLGVNFGDPERPRTYKEALKRFSEAEAAVKENKCDGGETEKQRYRRLT